MPMPTVKSHTGFPDCIHLSVQFNQHAVYYETARKWADDQEWLKWVSEEEKALAIERDSIWTCQWYPITPVGFYALGASSFEVLMDAVRRSVLS